MDGFVPNSRHQGQHVLVVYARTLGADERRFYEDYIIRAIGITGGVYLGRESPGDNRVLDR